MGENTIASGGTSLSTGFQTESSGLYSATFGVNSIAQGNTSAAMGYGTIASDYGSLVIGVNNLLGSTLTSDANNINLDNTAFVIGNGADANNRSDALTVLFDGTTNVAGSVTATSFVGDGSGLTNLPIVNYSTITNTPLALMIQVEMVFSHQLIQQVEVDPLQWEKTLLQVGYILWVLECKPMQVGMRQLQWEELLLHLANHQLQLVIKQQRGGVFL